MNNGLLAFSAFAFIFALLWLSVVVGYRLGVRKRKQDGETQAGIVKVAEATVFALLGLLVAFSFAGAYDRFENRKFKIIEETNAIHTAYDSVKLLKPAVQKEMRDVIKRYLDERILTYGRLAEFHGFEAELSRFSTLSGEVWNKAIESVKQTGDESSTLLFISAINKMIDVASTRILITRIHPPTQIFILLIGLAALSSFLAGYNMAMNKIYNSVYTLCFTAIMAFTLYVIMDLEFPRIGMIRVDVFDRYLVEMRDNLG
jgi:hypothetical protein